ncbi:MAG: MATE family efflux transporter [Erysipelotrichaceae bacterium]|nr:MATE family efflux transporter [Erysipelotrichaceae bacterium]
MRQDRQMDMVNGPLLKNIILFSIPLMLSNFLQLLFNAADTIIVGKFAGENALAAVGATGSLCFLLTSLFSGLSVGSNVVIANAYGARDDDQIRRAVHTSIWLGIFCGLFLMATGFFLSRPMLQLMSTPENIIGGSTLYMRIYFAGVVALLIYNFGSAVLRSKGDTRRPLYFMMISGILNVLLNLLFVIAFKWDVAGVAVATVISETVSAVLVIGALLKETDAARLDPKAIRFDWPSTRRIIAIGIPAGIQGIVFALSNVVIQSGINSFDSSSIVAGNSAAANLESFVYIGTGAFTQAEITFTSQNIGAGKHKAASRIMLESLVLVTVSAFAIGYGAWYFGHTLLGLYTDAEAVKQVGLFRLEWVCKPLYLNGILDVFVNSMRGMGISTLPTIFMIAGICGVRLFWMATVFPLNRTLETIYMCYPISWIVTSVIQAVLWIFVYRHLKKKFASRNAQ